MKTDPAKRVPKSIGTDAKLLGTYTLTDLAVGLFPGVIVVLVVQLVLPSTASVGGYQIQTFIMPIAGVAVAVGLLFVYLTPSYISSLDWVAAMAGYHRRPTKRKHEDAKRFTQVERVHAESGAIERTDGAFVGVVQVEPPMLALATDEEWAAKTEAFQEFLNTTVEFPIQFYSTTRSFPVEEYLAQYKSRLSDSDVKDNPRLASLIEEYVAWYASELEERQMTIRDHYVVVTVRPQEVQFERESIVEQLARIPVLGLFVRALAAPPMEIQRAVLTEALDERLRRVTGGIREIDGCAAYPVPAEDASMLVADFWTGETQPYGDLARRFRTTPIVGGTR